MRKSLWTWAVATALLVSFFIVAPAAAQLPPVTQVLPDYAYPCGIVQVRVWIDWPGWIVGDTCNNGAGCLWLSKAGEPDIIPVGDEYLPWMSVYVFDGPPKNDYHIWAFFDIPEGTAEGWWSVVVNTGVPGSPESVLPDAFYIHPTCPRGRPGDLYVANKRGCKMIDPNCTFGAVKPEGNILQFDGVTGEFICVFAEGTEMVKPVDLAWGPNGNLFLAEGSRGAMTQLAGFGRILEFDGETGQQVGAFVKPEFWTNGGLTWASSLAFGGPDGNLFVLEKDGMGGVGLSDDAERIHEYDRQTGEFLGYVPITSMAPSGYVFPPDSSSIEFGPSGNLVMSSDFKEGVQNYSGCCTLEEFDVVTGASLGCLVDLSVFPTFLPRYGGFTITPDGSAWALMTHHFSTGIAPEPIELWDYATVQYLGDLTDGDCAPDPHFIYTYGDLVYGPGGDVFASAGYYYDLEWHGEGFIVQLDPATGDCLGFMEWTLPGRTEPGYGNAYVPLGMQIKPLPGDFGGEFQGQDWQVDSFDYDRFVEAFNGTADVALALTAFDFDHDADVDCDDWAAFEQAWTAGGSPPAFAPCVGYSNDNDGDGVHNDDDVCPNTPAGAPVDETGRPRADMNGDCAVDVGDFGLFQLSMTGPQVP